MMDFYSGCFSFFTFRFFVEFLKEVQSPFEKGLALDMGQLLSLPFVILGVILIVYSLKPNKKEEITKPVKKKSKK